MVEGLDNFSFISIVFVFVGVNGCDLVVVFGKSVDNSSSIISRVIVDDDELLWVKWLCNDSF